MDKPLLICTVGLPRSGKTTWAKQQGYPIVNPDAIRLAMYGQRYWGPGEKIVWTHAWYMVRSLFLAGHSRVILDATNTTRSRREDWDCSTDWRTVFHHIKTDANECTRRAMTANDEEIQPIIWEMDDAFQPLTEDERVYEP